MSAVEKWKTEVEMNSEEVAEAAADAAQKFVDNLSFKMD